MRHHLHHVRAAILVIFAVLAGSAAADETLKARTVSHSVSSLFIDAADGVEGHIIGSAKFVGMSFYEDGTVASVAYVANFDYIKGSGTYVTYQTSTFPDGSVLITRNTGSAVTEAGKTTFPDGSQEIIGGTGRYAGARGSGTYTGIRILPIPDGGDSYFDGVLNVKM